MKTKFRTSLIILILVFSGAFGVSQQVEAQKKAKAKNIILFIGDGMGTAHLYAGMTVSPQPFNLLQFPFCGFSITYSSDNYITDSAAGGTAISSGVKTKNGMIGVTPDAKPAKSITEYAHEKGLATGVLSTSAITHATPASFVAHNSGRGNYEDIAADFMNGTADVFIGGGQDHFMKRKDGRDLVAELKAKGYQYVSTLDELKNANGPKLAGLLAKEHMPKVSEGRTGALETMTAKAIEILSQDKDGFFLIVEGSMIDWGAHDKNIDYVTSEMIDLDKAIGVALEFAKNNKETLIVVTADHETGGLTLTGGNLAEHKVVSNFSQSDHTAVMVPILSYGPGSDRFAGIHQNTFFLENFLNLLRINK